MRQDHLGATELLRDEVSAFVARTPRERSSRATILAELGRLSDPCSRDADPVHVTGSALVLGSRGILLHLHKVIGRWMQPGGHVEPGEHPADAAVREAIEETGVAVHHAPFGPYLVHLDVHDAGPHVHLDLRYLLVGSDDEPTPPPGESQEVRWCSIEEALALADESLVDGVARLADLAGRIATV